MSRHVPSSGHRQRWSRRWSRLGRVGSRVERTALTDVSVLTPSYRAAQYIRDAILSVAGQEGVAVEHVVQDGGSDDGTTDALASVGERVLWTSEKDSGQSDALNRAFARASGDWIGWLNADEFYLPDALKTLVAVGEQEDADLVFADMALANDRGRFLRLLPQHVLVPRILPVYAAISSCAMLIRRSVLVSPPWDAELHGVMDRDLYLRLRRGGARFVYCPTIAAAFRVHSAQKTVRHADQFSREFTVVQQRYGYPSFRGVLLAGRAVQASCKLVTGAYARQFAASRFRYADLRWFASPSARTVVDELIQSNQRGRAPTPARAATASHTTIE